MGVLFAFVSGIVIVGAVVNLTARMLLGRKLSREELLRTEQASAFERDPPILFLPTLTTEGTAKVGRDPDFEREAMKLRIRGMGF